MCLLQRAPLQQPEATVELGLRYHVIRLRENKTDTEHIWKWLQKGHWKKEQKNLFYLHMNMHSKLIIQKPKFKRQVMIANVSFSRQRMKQLTTSVPAVKLLKLTT